MSKSNSVGTKLEVNAKAVGGLKSIDGIDITADPIDVTDLGNTSGYKESLAGFKDGGEVSVSGFLDGENEGQDEVYTLVQSGNVVPCAIVFPAAIGKTWSFNACVTEFKTGIDVSDAITFDCKLKVSGKPELVKTEAG